MFRKILRDTFRKILRDMVRQQIDTQIGGEFRLIGLNLKGTRNSKIKWVSDERASASE